MNMEPLLRFWLIPVDMPRDPPTMCDAAKHRGTVINGGRSRPVRIPHSPPDFGRERIAAALQRQELAFYTGVATWANSPAETHRAAASALAGGESQPSFVENFEAEFRPAYGVLLDALLAAGIATCQLPARVIIWMANVVAISGSSSLTRPLALRKLPSSACSGSRTRY